MKSAPLLLGFCLLAPGLFALAPHPSVLTVKYKDQMLPVVRVDGTDAYVVADDSARESLTDALGGWYFLPKLKAGQPVSIRINVPLQF